MRRGRGPIVRAVEAKGIINPEQTFFSNPAVSGTIQDIFCDAVDRSKADLMIAQAQLAKDEIGLAWRMES
jgi:hypothetical protein